MFAKIGFIFEQYFILLVFVAAFYGYGRYVGEEIKVPIYSDAVLQAVLNIVLGIGVFIVALQILGIFGFLNRRLVQVLLVIGVVLASIGFYEKTKKILTGKPPGNTWYCLLVGLLFVALVAPTLALPLYPPVHWDDLMYHLPHVREWVQAEQITVNEWLRYPYFPYNFNLLYVAWMTVGNELNTNMLHALAGWLIAILIFRLIEKNFGILVAAVATAVWISVSQWFFQTSYIDLGAALFIFSSSVSLMIWIREDDKKVRSPWLLVAAFFMGLAAGTKYQAFTYLPFFMVTVLWYERRVVVWMKIVLAFLLPCFFWYLRNGLLTGNPVNPLAGGIFGYFDWNQGDYEYQLFDLKNAQNWPPKELWAGLLLLFFPAAWRDKAVRWLMLLSIYAVLVWLVTSHYDRYLLPQYPVLAVLAALALYYVGSFVLSSKWKNAVHSIWHESHRMAAPLLAVTALGLIVHAWPVTYRTFAAVPVTAQERHVYIYQHAMGFGLLLKLKLDFPEEKVYQVGLEGGIFYGPKPVYGDHFGPWRYRDFIYLPMQELHEKLMQHDFGILALSRAKAEEMEESPDFWKYFEKVAEDNGDTAYRLWRGDKDEYSE